MPVNCQLFDNDLPDGLLLGDGLAVSCAAMGQNPWRDRLCRVQVYDGNPDGLVQIVQFSADGDYAAPNLRRVLSDPEKEKISYFARGNMRWLGQWLGVIPDNVYCLKIASRVARTYTQSHGLEDILRQLLGIRLVKDHHPDGRGEGVLSDEQLKPAYSEVLHLHAARAQLDAMLAREGRREIVQGLNACLPALVRADLAGWMNEDLFSPHIPKPA